MIDLKTGRGFPFEYYKDKILTELEAHRNREIIYSYTIYLPKRASKKVNKIRKIVLIAYVFNVTIGSDISPSGAMGLTPPIRFLSSLSINRKI